MSTLYSEQKKFKYQNLTNLLPSGHIEVGTFINSRKSECPIMFVPSKAEFMCTTDKECMYEVVGDLMILTSRYSLHKIEATIKFNPNKPIALSQFLSLEPISTYSINLNKVKDKTALLLYKFISDSWEKSKHHVEVL